MASWLCVYIFLNFPQWLDRRGNCYGFPTTQRQAGLILPHAQAGTLCCLTLASPGSSWGKGFPGQHSVSFSWRRSRESSSLKNGPQIHSTVTDQALWNCHRYRVHPVSLTWTAVHSGRHREGSKRQGSAGIPFLRIALLFTRWSCHPHWVLPYLYSPSSWPVATHTDLHLDKLK